MEARHVAVVNESEFLTAGELAKGAAAVQKQVNDDFSPVWGVSATVSAFPSLLDVPQGYHPVVVRDDIGVNQLGVHLSESGDRPFALVLFSGRKWTVTLSHEVLELLVDPLGTLFLPGPPARDDQGDVLYLAEVCDACQSDRFAYPVNGDQLVSDFVTPGFYKALGEGRYSFAGNISRPREILAGGYLTWKDPATQQWWQVLDAGEGPEFRRLDPDEGRPDLHLRGTIDRDTNQYLARRRRKRAGRPRSTPAEKRLQQRFDRAAAAAKTQAAWWRKQIDRVSRPG